MDRLYSASDSDIEVSKQAWMKLFNSWTITHSYIEEMHTYQPEDLNLILELRKTNGTNYGKITGKNSEHVAFRSSRQVLEEKLELLEWTAKETFLIGKEV